MTSPSPCPDDLALEHDHLRWTQFCFSSGEPIQQEGDAARSGSTGKLPDELVGGRLETRRDGGICADLGAFRLVRSAAMAFANPLDLVADPPRQNGSISGDHALQTRTRATVLTQLGTDGGCHATPQELRRSPKLSRSRVSVDNHSRPKPPSSAASASFTAMSNWSKNSAAMTCVPVVRDAGFKRCCLRSKRFDGTERNYYFQGTGLIFSWRRCRVILTTRSSDQSRRPEPSCASLAADPAQCPPVGRTQRRGRGISGRRAHQIRALLWVGMRAQQIECAER